MIKTNIGYFRVSKEDETIQDLEQQIKAVQDFFSIEFDITYKERGSAYKLEKIQNREEFFKLLELLFDADRNKITNLFSNVSVNKKKNLYVWDYDRIMRNIQLNTLFIVLCDLFDVTIYSYKDGKTIKKENETPSETFARYMLNSVHAFTGEQYSYTISENVKKNIVKNGNFSVSNKGNKWGRYFRATEDNPDKNEKGNVKLTPKQAESLLKFIKKRINYYQKIKHYGYYPLIIEEVERKYKIRVSDAYISKIKNV